MVGPLGSAMLRAPPVLITTRRSQDGGGGVGPSSSLLCPGDLDSNHNVCCALQILSQNTQVAAWLNQAYHAQMIQIGFPSFLAYQASLGRLGPQVLSLSASLELIINFSYQV